MRKVRPGFEVRKARFIVESKAIATLIVPDRGGAVVDGRRQVCIPSGGSGDRVCTLRQARSGEQTRKARLGYAGRCDSVSKARKARPDVGCGKAWPDVEGEEGATTVERTEGATPKINEAGACGLEGKVRLTLWKARPLQRGKHDPTPSREGQRSPAT